jgi:hypothetical protein
MRRFPSRMNIQQVEAWKPLLLTPASSAMIRCDAASLSSHGRGALAAAELRFGVAAVDRPWLVYFASASCFSVNV